MIILSIDFNYWSGFYLHWVDDDGEGRVVPLAAALLSPTPGAFTTTMDGADSENTQDHHDNQETHTYHYDNGSCSWHHCKKKYWLSCIENKSDLKDKSGDIFYIENKSNT